MLVLFYLHKITNCTKFARWWELLASPRKRSNINNIHSQTSVRVDRRMVTVCGEGKNPLRENKEASLSLSLSLSLHTLFLYSPHQMDHEAVQESFGDIFLHAHRVENAMHTKQD